MTNNATVKVPINFWETAEGKNINNRIPAEFLETAEGKHLCTTMHNNAWEALDCLNAELNALSQVSASIKDERIKAVLERARVKVIDARAACRKAMAILTDETF